MDRRRGLVKGHPVRRRIGLHGLVGMPKRDDVVVEDRVDLDVAAQGADVVDERAQVEIVAALDPWS